MNTISLQDRLNRVKSQIKKAAEKSNRSSDDICLVAISKNQPIEVIKNLIECGHFLFGESRIHEAMLKIPFFSSSIRWNFIGKLQSNKIKKALPLFDLFHSIDSYHLLEKLNNMSKEMSVIPRILLQVNMSGEYSKQGFNPIELEKSFMDIISIKQLNIEGFMTIAPLTKDPENSRPYFKALCQLRDKLSVKTGISFPILSMGMSQDFEVAIEEGSTLVRLGSALFESLKNRLPTE